MAIERGDAVALTRELIRLDSRNPSLVPGAPGEGAVARVLASVLEAWGARVDVREAAPGRPNVIARFGSALPGAPTLLFNGHMDVVGIDGMVHPPFDGVEEGGRIYARGATDMKGGVAAMCAAAVRAADAGVAGEIIVAAVIDEEYESLGTRALLAQGVRADAAVVTEPTRLAIAPAHRGFAWIDVTVHGRAAHGSRYDIGVDAIRLAGLILTELDGLDAEVLTRRTHPLLGRASVHASLIEGGTGMSTYPDRCVLRLERRTLPGERAEDALAEVRDCCARVMERRPALRAEAVLSFHQGPSDVATNHPIVRAVADAAHACGERVTIEGLSAWTDAALLNDAGIPAICYGPGDIALAHAAEEWVEVNEIRRAAHVLTALAQEWCSARGAGDARAAGGGPGVAAGESPGTDAARVAAAARAPAPSPDEAPHAPGA
ncbi:MAG TPA: ArgE/DapE family deacylase [Gemmatimonadaceae bacterium]|nr:ArgE/DapE family deacylase [Gemmatimonadaceae bacterium]